MEKRTHTSTCDGCGKVVSFDQMIDARGQWNTTDDKSHSAQVEHSSWRLVAALASDVNTKLVQGNACSHACEKPALIKLLTASIERDKASTL
jgi:hypothetical protein